MIKGNYREGSTIEFSCRRELSSTFLLSCVSSASPLLIVAMLQHQHSMAIFNSLLIRHICILSVLLPHLWTADKTLLCGAFVAFPAF